MTDSRLALGLALSLASVSGWAQSTAAANANEAPAVLGQRVYEQRCAICHAPPGVGFVVLSRRTAPGQADLAARANVPEPLVRTVVRRGIGLMAPFTKVAISDAELAGVAAYLGREAEGAVR